MFPSIAILFTTLTDDEQTLLVAGSMSLIFLCQVEQHGCGGDQFRSLIIPTVILIAVWCVVWYNNTRCREVINGIPTTQVVKVTSHSRDYNTWTVRVKRWRFYINLTENAARGRTSV